MLVKNTLPEEANRLLRLAVPPGNEHNRSWRRIPDSASIVAYDRGKPPDRIRRARAETEMTKGPRVDGKRPVAAMAFTERRRLHSRPSRADNCPTRSSRSPIGWTFASIPTERFRGHVEIAIATRSRLQTLPSTGRTYT
jgi:hypothetical protein